MTNLNLAASPAATAIAGFLTLADPPPSCAVHQGVLTPIELDARPNEIEALISRAAVHDLGWLRRLAVRGSDRSRWLSGMVTNMVKDLPSSGGAWNLVLNAQGRIQGDLTVWKETDDLEIEVTAGQLDKLLAHLDRFIIMDDVELVPVEGQTAIGLSGPKAPDVLSRLGLPGLPEPMTQARAQWTGIDVLVRRNYGAIADHYALWLPETHAATLWKAAVEAGAKPVGTAAFEALRVAEGIPAYGIDMVERDLPQETSQTRALHFNKGCYLGQEIVERIHSRGNVHRHLRSLELEGPQPEPGTKLTGDGDEAGHITSAVELPLAGGARKFAIGMIRSEAEARGLPLHYTVGEVGGTARILTGPPAVAPGLAGMER